MRGEVLDIAKKTINGKRQDDYGNPENSFETIAKYWNVYLDKKLKSKINKEDVAMMMSLFKIARLQNNVAHQDSMVDCCGYLALAYDMIHQEPETPVNCPDKRSEIAYAVRGQ